MKKKTFKQIKSALTEVLNEIKKNHKWYTDCQGLEDLPNDYQIIANAAKAGKKRKK